MYVVYYYVTEPCVFLHIHTQSDPHILVYTLIYLIEHIAQSHLYILHVGRLYHTVAGREHEIR